MRPALGAGKLLVSLRDYQQSAVEAIREAYRSGRKAPLFVLPTGGGKTVTFVYIAANAARKGKRVCILVHRDRLVWQTSAELTRWGVPHGIIAAGTRELERPVQVASVQTLVRRLDSWPHFDLVIVDEAHHAVAGTWKKIIAHMPYALALGVTATPARLDGKGLGKIFDDMIFGPTMAELIGMGNLAPYELYAPGEVPDMKGIRKTAGDFNRGDAAAKMMKSTITGDAVSHYQRHVGGRPAIAFCVTVAHAEAVARQFREAGFRAATIDGDMEKTDQRRMIEDLGRGRLQVLTSCELISEGVDVPVCQAAILLRPTQSLTLYLQQVGRALRPKEDGSPAIILDHAGNSLRHGLPDAPRQWTLADGFIQGSKAEREKRLTRICKHCFAVFEVFRKACPVCGGVVEAEKGLPRHVAGELVKAAGMSFPTDIRDLSIREVLRQAKTREQLQVVARIRGFREGWVDHVLAGKQRAREQSGRRHYGRPW